MGNTLPLHLSNTFGPISPTILLWKLGKGMVYEIPARRMATGCIALERQLSAVQHQNNRRDDTQLH